METKQPPKVLPIKDLPVFVQDCVSKIWEEHGEPKNKQDVMFTYFDAIYSLHPLTQDWYIHESVHFVRQGAGEDEELAKQWWDRYTNEPAFRLEEELMAYKAQYQFIKRRLNKPQAFEYAKALARSLSSPIYGNIISFHGALNAIIQ